MNKNKILIIGLVLLCLSCAKKYGCIDSEAENFDPKATRSNHTCYYNELLKVQLKGSSLSDWEDEGVDSLRFYMNLEHLVTEPINPLIKEIKIPYVSHKITTRFHLLVVGSNNDTIRNYWYQSSSNLLETTITL